MRLKKAVWIVAFAILASMAAAQNVEHENVLHVSYGGLWQQDQYLSPLLYSGQRVGIGNEWWQPLRGAWHHLGRFDAQFGWTYSSAHTNLIYSLGVSGGWGAYYNWHFRRTGIELLLGPYLDLDWLGKMHGSSVNKPFSMDAALDLCAMGGIAWSFRARTTSYRLRYLVRANIIGVDFLPDYWQSYYELAEGVPGRVRCTTLTNHRTLRHELTMDMQFHRSTWRVGVAHEYVEYGERGMMFSREQVSAVVGCIWHYRINPAKSLAAWNM